MELDLNGKICLASNFYILIYPDLFWENLIPETALLAAEYYKFCLGRGMDLDEILPDVPRFVNAINLVFSQVKQEKAAQVKAAIEFIGQQLLQTALLMEYSDETCRKEMLACTCEIMTIVALENETVKLAVHLILKLSLNQADFIR
jgi:hypothetical protein